MTAAPTFKRLTAGAFVLATLAASLLPAACSSEAAPKKERLCTPGNYVFCRCQDRQEGSKLCNEDGASFGPCEPCETFDNPEIPPDDYPPDNPPDKDAAPPGECGDGIVQQGEGCDDKNTDDADGCDQGCKLAGADAPATRSCPGLDVHVWGGAHEPTLVSNTNGSGNRSASPTCGSSTGNIPTTGAAASDRVFKVTAHKSGSMTVSVTDATYDSFLYVAEACAPSTVTWFACANKTTGTNPLTNAETMTFPVDAGKTYYVFVDGYGISDNQGPFRVTFKIP